MKDIFLIVNLLRIVEFKFMDISKNSSFSTSSLILLHLEKVKAEFRDALNLIGRGIFDATSKNREDPLMIESLCITFLFVLNSP